MIVDSPRTVADYAQALVVSPQVMFGWARTAFDSARVLIDLGRTAFDCAQVAVDSPLSVEHAPGPSAACLIDGTIPPASILTSSARFLHWPLKPGFGQINIPLDSAQDLVVDCFFVA